jgi:succinate dehydrogenase/fumarate reductase flavoprotein subunit
MTNWYDYVQKDASHLEWPYPIKYGKENTITSDVLIIGGGVAGCHAAINAVRRGAKVVVIDKGPVRRSGCSGAGVDHWHAACTNPCSKVTPEELLAKYEKEGDSYGELGDGITCYITAKEGYDALVDVEKMGVPVRDLDDEFVGAEFRDGKTRYMFAYDYENRHIIRVSGGGDIKPAMYSEVKRLGATIYDFVMATSLLTEGGKQGGRVIGATGLNLRTGEFYVLKAKATILSAGGCANLFAFSTELRGSFGEPNQTGDGTAMAWAAGAECTMQDGGRGSSGGFMYFPHSAGNAHNSWYACNIVDANGKEVPWIDRKDGRALKTLSERYRLPPGEIFIFSGGAPTLTREPSVITDLPERIAKGEFRLPLYADLPSMPEHERRAIYGLQVGNEGCTRYGIYDVFTKAGFDPDIDMPQAPVMPADQYVYTPWWMGMAVRHWRSSGGGIVFDWDLKSNLPGLYVAGVQGGGGDHSTSATTGRYAGRKAADYARTASTPVVDEKQVEAEKARVYAPVQRQGEIGWKELKAGLSRIMQDYCGEYKNEGTLKLGLDWLKSISESEAASVYARNPHELARTVECLTHITLGEMMLHAALARMSAKPSKGSITIRLDKGKVQVSERAPRWWLKPPYASTYPENFRKHSGL